MPTGMFIKVVLPFMHRVFQNVPRLHNAPQRAAEPEDLGISQGPGPDGNKFDILMQASSRGPCGPKTFFFFSLFVLGFFLGFILLFTFFGFGI